MYPLLRVIRGGRAGSRSVEGEVGVKGGYVGREGERKRDRVGISISLGSLLAGRQLDMQPG